MVGFGASPKQVSLLHEFKGDFIDEESVSLLRFDWKQIIGQTKSPQNHEKWRLWPPKDRVIYHNNL